MGNLCGLTCYLDKNSLPPYAVELRLVINAGAVLEKENEQGAAHFIEHLAFKSRAFDGETVQRSLEKLGINQGSGLNGYTGYDETIYSMQVPVDNKQAVESAVRVLAGIAYNMDFTAHDLEQERKIILEEQRMQRGAPARAWDEHSFQLFQGSRYAERPPVGTERAILDIQAAQIRNFYKQWYRPDLMAVIGVGNTDEQEIAQWIIRYFSSMVMQSEPEPRVLYQVPYHQTTLFSVKADKETTKSKVQIIIKYAPGPLITVGDYKALLTRFLLDNIFTGRINTLSKKSPSLFLHSYAGNTRLIRTSEAFIAGAEVPDNGIEAGLEALVKEMEKIKKTGVDRFELEMAEKDILQFMKTAYEFKTKTPSEEYAVQYADHFLKNYPVLDIDYEYRLVEDLLPGITCDDVKALAAQIITPSNRVVLIDIPEKPGIAIPDTSHLEWIVQNPGTQEDLPGRVPAAGKSLLGALPCTAVIVKETTYPAVDVTEWRLSNGVKVVLKPGVLKGEQILLTAFRPGGYALAAKEDNVPARTAAEIVAASGAGNFTGSVLNQKLMGTGTRVVPWEL